VLGRAKAIAHLVLKNAAAELGTWQYVVAKEKVGSFSLYLHKQPDFAYPFSNIHISVYPPFAQERPRRAGYLAVRGRKGEGAQQSSRYTDSVYLYFH